MTASSEVQSRDPLETKWAPGGSLDLDNPPPDVLSQLESLPLSDNDVSALLGDGLGFSAADFRTAVRRFWFALRERIRSLLCRDEKLRASASAAIQAGATAVAALLVGMLGLQANTVAEQAIGPLAVGIALNGLGQLCE